MPWVALLLLNNYSEGLLIESRRLACNVLLVVNFCHNNRKDLLLCTFKIHFEQGVVELRFLDLQLEVSSSTPCLGATGVAKGYVVCTIWVISRQCRRYGNNVADNQENYAWFLVRYVFCLSVRTDLSVLASVGGWQLYGCMQIPAFKCFAFRLTWVGTAFVESFHNTIRMLK